MDDKALRDEVSNLLENCKGKQLEMIKKICRRNCYGFIMQRTDKAASPLYVKCD